jgi:hypothetical protein
VQRGCATAEEIGEGEAADDTLLEIRVPIGSGTVAAHGEQDRDDELRCFRDASGANHCASRN